MRNKKGQFNKGERTSINTEFKKGIIPWNKGKSFPAMIGNKHCVGRTPWNKGRKCPEISIAKIGKKRPDMVGKGFKKGSVGPNKGKKLTKEQKSKLNLSGLLKGRGWNKGIPSTWIMGTKNHMWKNGVTPLNKKIRKSIEFKKWREDVFIRDNYTDQKNKIKGGVLRPHHILNFAEYPELRFDINNGITLSEESHNEFHKKYGKFNNTREQLEEFLKN
jgi:hypothetical protein